MTTKPDGGPAFPVSVRKNENYMDEGGYGRTRTVTVQEGGMSLRQWYAGMALQGMLAYSHVNPQHGNYHENCTIADAAAEAFKYADAMIAEGEK